eukprot:COSAG01_NODE_8345_length_2821_cov_11.207568_1_plen_50_part_00
MLLWPRRNIQVRAVTAVGHHVCMLGMGTRGRAVYDALMMRRARHLLAIC